MTANPKTALVVSAHSADFAWRAGGAIALHAAGWRDEGVGMLDPVVDALHRVRTSNGARHPKRSDTRLAVAALHQALATDPTYGPAFRRSAGIQGPAANQSGEQRKWWTDTLADVLNITKPSPHHRPAGGTDAPTRT